MAEITKNIVTTLLERQTLQHNTKDILKENQIIPWEYINCYLHSTSCLVDRNAILKLGRKYVFGIC